VVAREWERGTIEALFVTPVRPGEILLGKTIPYFGLGMIGFAHCVITAKFLFDVPLRGSVLVLTGVSMLYLLVALALGLLISSALKSQFVASQITLFVTFLLPARYYVTLLQTIFLVGDVWAVIVPNAAVLAGMMTVLLWLARRATRKQLA
jgi:ABC-2 type transport system permease protein